MSLVILYWVVPIILLGIGILVFGIWKLHGKLRTFVILTGSSILGFFIAVLLHNAFYGLGTITSHITVLSHLMESLHVIFFCLALFVCPAGAIVGIVGSIVLATRKRGLSENRESEPTT